MIKIKHTLSSQEYNEMFKEAAKNFDEEMIKRDIAIKNMSKKLMIINYANEFIETKIASLNNSIESNNMLVTFKNDLGGSYNQFGYVVHPKFKKEPIDIFNLKLTSGNTMFKNSLKCKINDVEDDTYINFLMADNALEKEIIFEEFKEETLTLEYTLNSEVSLGTMRFNVIEIDPYIYGAYTIDYIEFFSLNELNGTITETPIKTVYSIKDIGKTRIILDDKIKFSKVVFHFNLIGFRTQVNNIDIYPFGLKHIYFYEADFLDDSTVIIPIRSKDYIEYIYNDITLYHAGEPIQSTTDYYNIEFYTDFINNTLTGKVYTSSSAAAYRIAKNTKVLYAKVPLIWANKATITKQYLSLTGILFNYVVDEDTMI